jgi:hypothetical protein
MPLDDLAGGLLSGVFRFIGNLLFEVFVEFLFHGTGRLITRLLFPDRHFEETTLTVLGLLFWIAVPLLLFFGYRTLS